VSKLTLFPQRMRILILAPEYSGSGGGIIAHYRTLAPALVQAGCEVNVIEGSQYNSDSSCGPVSIDGVMVERLTLERLKASCSRFTRYTALPSLRNHLAAAWAIWDQARNGMHFDIVEACDWGFLFVPPVLDATKPCVVQLHGSVGQISIHDPIVGEEAQDSLERLIERGVMGKAQAIQAFSQANADFWRRQTGREISMIRPAWQAHTMAQSSAVGERGLVVGRVQAWKGPHVLCEALRLLGDRAPDIDWIGRDTAFKARGRTTSEHLSITFPDIWGPKIHWHAQIDPNAVARAQSQALFNLIPSTWDTFNFTVIEAMASGRPVICSKGAGASELIENGVHGFVFEAGNATSLASAIDQTLNCPRQRLFEIGHAARNLVDSELEPDKIAAKRIQEYKKIIDEFTARPETGDDWLHLACKPAKSDIDTDMSFLDHLPLKSILQYSGQRALRKALGRL
jgi:glycosyltransferase involved in cell wall biosynthesis